MALNYAKYLKIPELLKLQHEQSDPVEHDEMLFIIIHQTYELWFKLMLHEFDKVKGDLSAGDLYGSIATFQRVRTIMKTLVAQLDILETMTPLEFTSFRERLEAASGFQSDQFRALEFELGRKSELAVARFPKKSRARAGLERRYDQPTVWDAFLAYLHREGYLIPTDQLERDVTAASVRHLSDGSRAAEGPTSEPLGHLHSGGELARSTGLAHVPTIADPLLSERRKTLPNIDFSRPAGVVDTQRGLAAGQMDLPHGYAHTAGAFDEDLGRVGKGIGVVGTDILGLGSNTRPRRPIRRLVASVLLAHFSSPAWA